MEEITTGIFHKKMKKLPYIFQNDVKKGKENIDGINTQEQVHKMSVNHKRWKTMHKNDKTCKIVS